MTERDLTEDGTPELWASFDKMLGRAKELTAEGLPEEKVALKLQEEGLCSDAGAGYFARRAQHLKTAK